MRLVDVRVGFIAALLALASLAAAVSAASATSEALVVFGDPAPDRAIILIDAPGATYYEFRYRHDAKSQDAGRILSGRFDDGGSGTTHLVLDDLVPETRYVYRLTLASASRESDAWPIREGEFVTAPEGDVVRAVRFAFGGDLGGQNVCRDASEGYPIFRAINALELEFFVALGDMIYADDVCEATGRYGNEQIPRAEGPAATPEEFRAHWRYNQADPGLSELLATRPYVAVWDDHEVQNDFGPANDLRQFEDNGSMRHLMPIGLRAFLDHNPLPPGGSGHARLYRTVSWGRLATLFLLDTRQYRSRAHLADTPEHAKSMLGAAQREWLEASLRHSNSIWQIIVSSVPLGVPSGRPEARDGWASGEGDTGYEREALAILRDMHDIGLRNVLWLTTDVHFATALRYVPFGDAPDFVVYEIVAGPLQAGQFPKQELDPSLRPERLFFHGAETPEAVVSYAQSREYVNFGVIEIDTNGRLRASLRDVNGAELYALQLAPR